MKFLSFSFAFLFIFQAFSQSTFEENVINPLQKNPVQQEKIFVHTNKTSYSPEDTIWFKVYTGMEDNKPSLQTTVVHVNLLNSKGNLITRKKIFIYKGVGNGEFTLEISIDPGTYFIQAYTQNSLNFGNDYVFTSKIEVLGENSKVPNYKKNYDVQILPEGGYLVENTMSTIGIKALLNGKGIGFSGKIINNNNEEIKSFSSQHKGMGKCRFFYKAGQEYSAYIKIRDTLLKIKIPKARQEGISLGIDNSSSQNLKIDLRTNKSTLAEAVQASYVLLYHQRNRIAGYLDFSNLDSLQAAIIVNKKLFFEGVNSVTLFKNLEPIAERKFYIEKKSKEVTTEILRIRATNDSILYKAKFQNGNRPISANVSISVLSGDPKNFTETQNIQSAFLLSPFINGFIENPAYYFNRKNEDRKTALDLLMLTQGWSGYSLKEMVAELNPHPTHSVENGISLKGTVQGILSTNTLGLISNKNRLIDKIYLNGKKQFEFEKLLLYTGDTIKFSFLDHQNKAIKPNKIILDSLKRGIPKLALPELPNNVQNDYKKEENISFYTEGVTQLEEVKLSEKKRSERFRRLKKLQKKYKPLVWDIGKYYEIPLPNQTLNFKDNLMDFLSFEENVELVHSKNNEYYLKIPIKREAALYVDGKRIASYKLPGFNIEMKKIENIMVQPVGRGNRVYQVFTTENYKKNIEELFESFIIKNGYDRPEQYYHPLYSFNVNKYMPYQEIDWNPDIQTNKQGEVFFKVPKPESNHSYFFSIQGFSEQGLLISGTITE